MKNLAILIVLLILAANMTSQTTPPTIIWQKCYGGSRAEVPTSFEITSDSGYIISTISYSNDGDVASHYGSQDSADCWVIKVDHSGNIQWQRTLGGTGPEDESHIIQTNDGGYLIGISTPSMNGDVSGHIGGMDCWIVKLDSAGNTKWQRIYGGSNNDYVRSLIQTNDGGFIIGASTSSNDGDITGHHGWIDFWVVKLDTGGHLQWQRSLGGSYNDELKSIRQTSDGGYIAAGATASNDGDVTGVHNTTYADCWVVKLDSTGNIQWQKCFGGSSGDYSSSVIQTNDGYYIVAGYSYSNDGDVTGHHGATSTMDYWILKIDHAGNLIWQRSFGGTQDDNATSVIQASDGNYIVAGSTSSNDGDVTGFHGTPGNSNMDYWVLKLDTSGNIIWEKTYGGTDSDGANFIRQASDGTLSVSGSTWSYDGDVSPPHGMVATWMIRLGYPTGISSQPDKFDISIFPDPAPKQFTVRLPSSATSVQLLNSLGQNLYNRDIHDQRELDFKVDHSGIYFLRVVTCDIIIMKKVVVN